MLPKDHLLAGKLFHEGVRRLALYTTLATLWVAIIYYWPNQDPNSGKKLFQKRTVINAVLRSFLYTMRKSKLVLSIPWRCLLTWPALNYEGSISRCPI